MELPQPFTIAGVQYYNSKDLMAYNPVFYYGCKSKPRTIIEKKKISTEEYIYANSKSGEWNISNADCKKAQLLLSASWVDIHFFRKERNDVEPIESEKEAPEILFLEEEEKFRDTEGNVVEIETRGERNRKKIFFRVKDVMAAFEMPNLDCIIRNENTDYKKEFHYQHFFIRVKQNPFLSETIKKELYLTYKGLIRVLFASNAGNAEKFQDWAEDKLFTIQMGNKEEKIKVGTAILKITPNTFKSVFSKYANKLPCIYLIKLGTVAQLREIFRIDASVSNEKCVYKYGFTDDLRRRIGEHEGSYGKMIGVKIELISFQMIDPQYISEAESEIREECNAYELKLKTEGHNELIVMNEKQIAHLKKNYGRIGKEFEGHSTELKEEIVKLKEELKDLANELKTKELQFKLQLQEEISEKERYKTLSETNERIYNLEIKNRDLQIQTIQLKSPVII